MTKIYRPSVPFIKAIPGGGIEEGKAIEIKGRIPYGADRIGINLLTSQDPNSDRALHLSIRFDQQCVIRTHQVYGRWGIEETSGPFPFSFCRNFKLLIAVERNGYRIAVDDMHRWDFGHRLPVQYVKSISMFGTVEVQEIEFLGRRRHVEPPRHNLPRVWNPTVPYTYPMYDGLRNNMAIYISGRPSSNARKFSISLQKGASQYPLPDVAFHFEPKFINRSITRNARLRGLWGLDETDIRHFPFHPGVQFDLIIRIKSGGYKVSIDGQHFLEFRHRLKHLRVIDHLYIENDVIITSVSFS